MINFGTGGWRAIIGDDFIRENIQKFAQGVYEYAKEQGKTDKPIAIGYDRRFLSSASAKWLAEVLCANGIKVLATNRSTPTPLIMHTVKVQGLDYGIEVTASHNPYEYNGLKLFLHEGRDASVEVTSRIEEIINSLEEKDVKRMSYDKALEMGLVEIIKNPFNRFIDDIVAQMDMEKIRDRGPRILFDPMHGSGNYPLMVILSTARCTVDLLHSDKDAYFGGNMPAPSENSLFELSEKVVREKYDLGIALDGDGDRLGIIDSNGTYISANDILCMLYYYLHEYKGWKGPVVRNLATTHLLDRIAESFGEICYEVPVGFKHISSKLDEVDAVLGGESSGGLTVRGHIFGKDSIYASTLFVEMISVIGKTPTEIMAELHAKYGKLEMVEDNLRFAAEKKPEINDIIMVQKKLPEFSKKVVRVNYEDGCKVYFEDDSYVICRFSGTEPLLRIFAESSTVDKAKEYISIFSDFVFGRNN